MTTFLIATPIVALGMLGLGLSLLVKGQPMKKAGCGGHRSPKNGLLGDHVSSSCACQGDKPDSCSGC
jgi:hypothetical protein